MKKIILLMILSIFSISCFYEDDTMGAIIDNTRKDPNTIDLVLLIRPNSKSFNNITAIKYSFKKATNSYQSPLGLFTKGQFMKNATNIFSSGHMESISIDEKYENIQVKYDGKDLYVKDWNNKEHHLKYQGFPAYKSTDEDLGRNDVLGSGLDEFNNNSWTHVVFFLNSFLEKANLNDKETQDFFKAFFDKFVI